MCNKIQQNECITNLIQFKCNTLSCHAANAFKNITKNHLEILRVNMQTRS